MRSDVGILFLFFNKTETTGKVLQRILEAKPSVLLLSQDGARKDNATDELNVGACREAVEKLVSGIDWECEVHRFYSDANMGCDPKEYAAISWAFSIVDKLMIIEDDCLCAHSFFAFMEEMLIKYEKDERVSMISGMERFGNNPFCKDSYYFTQACCGCGWGSWKRSWEDVQRIAESYSYIHDDRIVKNLDMYARKCCLGVYSEYVNESRENANKNSKSGRMESWEFAESTAMILENRLAINPAVNLVKNIGVVPGATHSGNDVRVIPKRLRAFFELDYQEMDFPLKHPEYVLRDMEYEKMYDKKYHTNRLQKLADDIEHAVLCVRYGYTKDIIDGFRRRVKRLRG